MYVGWSTGMGTVSDLPTHTNTIPMPPPTLHHYHAITHATSHPAPSLCHLPPCAVSCAIAITHAVSCAISHPAPPCPRCLPPHAITCAASHHALSHLRHHHCPHHCLCCLLPHAILPTPSPL